MDTHSQSASSREHDSGSWWYLVSTKAYRYRALLGKYWWLVLFTTCAGFAGAAWKNAHQDIVYVSTGRMMVSGKINLPEGATYTEEMNLFISTQRELMQDEAVRRRADDLLHSTDPEVTPTPVNLVVAPLPATSIFILTATGAEPIYPQKFLDAVMHEYMATRHDMRTQKSEDAETSIEDEISRVQADVRKDEERLIAFQRENNIGFLEQGGNSAGAYLGKLNTQLAELKKESQLLDMFQLDQEDRAGREPAARRKGRLERREVGRSAIRERPGTRIHSGPPANRSAADGTCGLCQGSAFQAPDHRRSRSPDRPAAATHRCLSQAKFRGLAAPPGSHPTGNREPRKDHQGMGNQGARSQPTARRI